MPELTEVGVRLKVEGGTAAAAEVHRVDTAVTTAAAHMRAASTEGIASSKAHEAALANAAQAGEMLGAALGQKAVAGAQRLDSTLHSLSGSLWNLTGQALKFGAIGFGVMTTAAAGFGLKAVASLEDTRVAFENLTGSMAAGSSLMGQLQGLKQSTPFEAADLNNAAQTLLQGGVGQGSILPLMKSLADVAAGAPQAQRAGDLAQSASILARINAAGVVSGSDVTALGAAGFPIQKLLGQTSGLSAADLQRQIAAGSFTMPAGDLLSAIQSGAAGGGGNASRAAATLTGQFSDLKATLNENLASAAQPLADELQKQMPAITKTLGDGIEAVAPSINSLLATALHGLQAFVPILQPILTAVASGLDRVLTAMAPALTELQPLAGELGASVGDLFTALADQMPALVPLFVDLVGVLPMFVDDLAKLVPLVTPIADLLDKLLNLPGGAQLAAGALVVAFGWPVIGPIVGALGKLAASLWAVEEAEVAAAGAGGVAGAAGAAGAGAGAAGAGGLLSRFGKFGALLGGVGLLAGGAYESITGAIGTAEHGITGSGAFKTIAGATAAGAGVGLIGGPFAEVTVPVGAAVGAGVGVGETVIGGLVHHFTTNQVSVAVNNPATGIDVTRAVQDGLAAHQAEQDRRR